MSNEMIPEYATQLFTDIWPEVDKFISDYKEFGDLGSGKLPIKSETAYTLFYLLYSRFGNNPIANYDDMQWRFKIFTIIWQYGPTWEKRLEIQEKLRGLNDVELMTGAKQIYNHAFNPSSDPSAQTLDELNFINDQNTANYKRGKLEAYSALWSLLKIDVTNEFLNKFLVCFKKFARPARTWIYETDLED